MDDVYDILFVPAIIMLIFVGWGFASVMGV